MRNSYKIFILTGFMGVLMGWGWAAGPKVEQASPKKSEALSETIQGEIKEKLDIQKQPPAIQLEIDEIVESGTAQTDTVLQGARPIPSDADFEHYANLKSSQVMRPWNALLPEPPLVTFYPGLSNVAAKKWEFKVSNEMGDVVKSIVGKGVPPRNFEWNGLDQRGMYITVGTLYSYQFLTYDEHGNVHTIPGEPFQLDALKYSQKRHLYIEFSNEKLFVSEQALIRPTMQSLLDRAVDVIREHSSQPILVEMYAQSVKSTLAEERRQVLVDLISKATNIPAVDIRHKVDKIGERGDIVRLAIKVK